MNPELTHWTGPEGLPRFDLIKDDDFGPVIAAELARAEAAVEAVAANPAPADFVNTVAALETAEEPLDRALSVFYTLASVDSNPERQALERDLAPKLAGYGNKVMMDPRLFRRVEAVAESAAELPPQDARITELQLRARRRAGAGLSEDDRARLAAINEELASLTTQFSQNVLADERDFVMAIPDDRLAGLPDWLLGAMRARCFTNSAMRCIISCPMWTGPRSRAPRSRWISWNCPASFTSIGWNSRRCWPNMHAITRRVNRCRRTCWSGFWPRTRRMPGSRPSNIWNRR